MHEHLTVSLGDRSYPIYIGDNLLANPEMYRRHLPSRQVMIVTNETVAPLYLDQVRGALADYETDSVVLPDGEQFKTLETVNRIFDRLLEQRFNRRCTLVALGGGVIGDMTGFAAACYQRGVFFLQAPTTLLAQVDSSVGGKTGVNHRLGKNMIGAFHQPVCVIADTRTLTTLDDRQLAAGLAEVVKYGLISDPEFFSWLEKNMGRLCAREPDALTFAIKRSCRDKAEVVAADEREAGHRALLNLGHTFGHAIETATGYGRWLHGEAVAVGICMAADFSRRLGWLSATDHGRILALTRAAGLPTAPPPGIGAQRFLDLMAVDKKVLAGKLRLVLLEGIGKAIVTEKFNTESLRACLDDYR